MSKTYIVDGNSLLFRSYYSTAYPPEKLMRSASGQPINAIFAFHNLMKKIKSQLGPEDHLFVAFDTDKPTNRKKEFEDYKAQRQACPEELIMQFEPARELLDAMNIHWKEQAGYEADDLAGSMASYSSSKDEEVRLFSSDKDFLQLLTLKDNITVETPKKGLSETVVYTPFNLKELFGLNPDQITDYKAIAGDPSDNYKGIPGIGEKTAIKLLNEHGHVEDVIAFAKAHADSKTNQKIIDGEKDALFFKHLATIDTTLDMKEDYEKSIYQPYLKSKLASFYEKYNLRQFLNQIDKLDGIIDDLLFTQFFIDDAPLVKKDTTTFKKVNISSLDEIKEEIIAIAYDSSYENENLDELKGFALASDRIVFYLSLEDALQDNSFKNFLTSDKKIATYDLKGLLVHLSRNKLPFIKGVDFDLLLATYLLNPDSGQKVKDVFLSWDEELSDEENISSQIATLIAKHEKEAKERLSENKENTLFEEVELPLAEVMAKMEIEGVPLNEEVLAEIDTRYKAILESLTSRIYSLAGKEFNINSPKQLEQVLFVDLQIPRDKKEKGTSLEVLNAHFYDHPIIESVLTYRAYSKLVSGYTSSLPKHVFSDGKIHAIYNQALTSTGRLSMSEPNLQNISIRTDEGKQIRKAFFYPDKEFLILSIDYSQIELRMLAHIGDIKALKEIFIEGHDVHTATASRVFKVPLDEVTSEMRRKAKAVNFGIIYGISAFGLAEQLLISRGEAKELIESFKSTFVGIEDFQQQCVLKAREQGYVETILNRRRYLRDINSSNRAMKAFSERAAVNSVIQGSAADLIKIAMIKCDQVLKNYKSKIILQIHDELLFKVPKDEIEEIRPLLQKTMENALSLSIPLKTDANYADNWYEAH